MLSRLFFLICVFIIAWVTTIPLRTMVVDGEAAVATSAMVVASTSDDFFVPGGVAK